MSEPDTIDNRSDDSTVAAHLNKAERKKLRREEKQRQREGTLKKQQRRRRLTRALLWGGPLVLVAFVGWATARAPKTADVDDDSLISRAGIHWHADLAITIKGQPVTIPADIGLGTVHADMHTHTTNDQIHVEIDRPVRKEDIRLGKFFEIWGEPFSSTCILDACNGPEGTVKLLVNGVENTAFEHYLIQDNDKIEIRYE